MSILSEEVELYRDQKWRREPESRIETVADAERLINDLGFCAGLTDARRALPSLYIAVCGRRDAYTPRNVQKDPETSLAWVLKDEVLRRGKMFYSKLTKQALFVAPRLIPHFNKLFGIPKHKEKDLLTEDAQKILAVLRREWEQASADLRKEAGIKDRQRFNKALDELQNKMKVIPNEVIYEPKFTYIWTLAEARFPDELTQNVDHETALTEIARAYIEGAGQTSNKELSKMIGVTPLEANLACLLLVEQGFLKQISMGVYQLNNLTIN